LKGDGFFLVVPAHPWSTHGLGTVNRQVVKEQRLTSRRARTDG
jgi:hypothetical protein